MCSHAEKIQLHMPRRQDYVKLLQRMNHVDIVDWKIVAISLK
jgi:hypothetical protein